jgi:iron complex outermembrane receptor protein
MMKKTLIMFFVFVSGVCFLFNDCRIVLAAEDDKEEFTLEEIIVTSQKRKESLHEVPIAISVTTADQLERQQVYSVRDLERTTPALEFGNSGPGGAPTMRGIGTTTVVGIGEPSVGVNLNGVTQGNAILNSIFDVQRVEVLRGPQGTLYGDTASAGLINIITNAPDPMGFSAKVGFDITDDGTLGSRYSRREYRGMLNIPVSENSALRTVFNFNNTIGLRKNKVSGQDQENKDYGVRMHYLYKPNDDFSFDLIGNFSRNKLEGPSIFTAVSSVTPIHQAALASCGITASMDNQYVCHDFDEHNTTDIYTISAEFNFKAFGHEITSITSYSETEIGPWNWQIMGMSFPGLLEIRSTGQETSSDRYTTDFRITSPKDQKVEYIVGLWYNGADRSQDAIAYSEKRLPVPIPGFPPVYSYSNLNEGTNKNYAIYGNADIHLTEAFKLFAGARFSHYDLWTSAINMQVPQLPGDPPVGFETIASLKEDYFSYRLGGQYDVNEKWMFFLNTTNAVKTPVVSEPPFTNPNALPKIIKAEISTNYEAGVKGKLFNNKMAIESNIFYTTLEDFQGSKCFLEPATQALSCEVANIEDDVTSKGFEISLYGYPMSGLSVSAGYIYNIAEYPDGYPSDDKPPRDIGGEQLMNAPKHKFQVSTEYSHSLTNSLTGFVSADATYRTKRRLNLMDDPFSIYPAHWMVGARIGIRAQEDWIITLFARNLFGEPAPAALWPVSDGNNYQIVTPTQFRQVGLSLNYSF